MRPRKDKMTSLCNQVKLNAILEVYEYIENNKRLFTT